MLLSTSCSSACSSSYLPSYMCAGLLLTHCSSCTNDVRSPSTSSCYASMYTRMCTNRMLHTCCTCCTCCTCTRLWWSLSAELRPNMLWEVEMLS